MQGLNARVGPRPYPCGVSASTSCPCRPVAVASTDLPLLVVDLRRERGRCVRVVASELWSIENNLLEANMDFEEFTAAVDDGGVFRGF
ncbi:hypothetical protein [Streptomyces sp. RK62]|uniref:DUF6924 domain-containing protein n=1 Tax=Streptomyces sp. RK62 TaxID=2824893 RepID=UPI0035B1F705